MPHGRARKQKTPHRRSSAAPKGRPRAAVPQQVWQHHRAVQLSSQHQACSVGGQRSAAACCRCHQLRRRQRHGVPVAKQPSTRMQQPPTRLRPVRCAAGQSCHRAQTTAPGRSVLAACCQQRWLLQWCCCLHCGRAPDAARARGHLAGAAPRNHVTSRASRPQPRPAPGAAPGRGRRRRRPPATAAPPWG